MYYATIAEHFVCQLTTIQYCVFCAKYFLHLCDMKHKKLHKCIPKKSTIIWLFYLFIFSLVVYSDMTTDTCVTME